MNARYADTVFAVRSVLPVLALDLADFYIGIVGERQNEVAVLVNRCSFDSDTVCAVLSVNAVCAYDFAEIDGRAFRKRNDEFAACIDVNVGYTDSVLAVFSVRSVLAVRAVNAVFAVRNRKRCCFAVGIGYRICIRQTFRVGLFYGNDTYAVFSVCSAFALVAFFALRSAASRKEHCHAQA